MSISDRPRLAPALIPYQTWMDSRTVFSSSVSESGCTLWLGSLCHSSWNLSVSSATFSSSSFCSASSLSLYSSSWRKALVFSSSERSSNVPLTVPLDFGFFRSSKQS